MSYGGWAQYHRRRRKARIEQSEQLRGAITGLQCRECMGKRVACPECFALFDAWAQLHFGDAGHHGVVSPAAAARVAAR